MDMEPQNVDDAMHTITVYVKDFLKHFCMSRMMEAVGRGIKEYYEDTSPEYENEDERLETLYKEIGSQIRKLQEKRDNGISKMIN